jgi:hypothetical protein
MLRLNKNFLISKSEKIAKKALTQIKRVPEEPIFIVGCGHSGTSLMLAMLDTHSKLYAVPYESRIFTKLTNKTDILYQMLLWQKNAKRNLKERWIEKTPDHIYYLHKIFEIAPKAKIIAMLRDGRDVACSIKNRTGSIEDGINRWLETCHILSNYFNDSRVCVVKLEDLVANPENKLKEVMSFLHENYEHEMLDFHLVERRYYSSKIKKVENVSGKNHEVHRTWQINQPLMKNTVRYTNELTPQEINECENNLYFYLNKFRYLNTHA